MNIISKITALAAVSLLTACSTGVTKPVEDVPSGMFSSFKASKFSLDKRSKALELAQIEAEQKVKKPGKTKAKQETPEAMGTSEAANEVLISAMSLVGTPYRLGGDNPNEGFDCSGLITHVFNAAIEMELPRSSAGMSVLNVPKVDKNNLKTGDLVFFSTGRGSRINHVGIYVGKGRFIHSPRPGKDVMLGNLNDRYWVRTYRKAKRVITPQAMASTVKIDAAKKG